MKTISKAVFKFLLLFVFVSANTTLLSQPYQPNWQSLDTRAVPQWFKDAKFGIFIHWGIYAVPGWSTKGNYSELFNPF